jgi:hypothetical protein
MGMDAAPKRRWYQFSLRTFFVLVTIVCIGFGWWVHWCKEWIRQRHEALERGEVRDVSDFSDHERPRAPSGLWLFGEKGISLIDAGPESTRWSELFPEAAFLPPPIAGPT